MEFSGELKRDADWSGLVALTGDVVVAEGVTLRLRPGTELAFSPKPRWSCSVFRSAPEGYPIEATCRKACDIVVLGRLEASQARLCAGDGARWGGVTLLEAGRAELRGCSLTGTVEHGLQCFDDAALSLAGCTVSESRIGVLGWGLSRVAAARTRFESCETAVLCREGSFARLTECDFSRLSEGAWGQQWSLIEASRCRFTDCSNFRAGAYEQSRVRIDDVVVEGATSLR